jgi:murein DD-endopeptidase MepM/ murein hydrolase activator NlpD
LPKDSILSKKEEELQSIFEDIDATESQLRDIEERLGRISKELEKLEEEYEQTREEVKQVEEELQRIHEEIVIIEGVLDEKRERIDVLSDRLDAKLQSFNERLRSAYMSGFADYFQFFANSESADDFFDRLFMFQRVIRLDAALLQTLHDDAESLEIERVGLEVELQNLSGKQEKLVVLRELLEEKHDQLEETVKSRERLISDLEIEKVHYAVVLSDLTESSKRLDVAIRSLQGETFQDGSRGSIIDFIWPLNGRISSEFGWRVHPLFNTRKFHTGIDIAVVRGTPVKAVASGKVIYSGWVKGYGNTVILDHGNMITTLYGHNDELVCRAGAYVKIGDVIAHSGNTGNTTGPHLHFEIRKDGSPVNPIDLLP